jgi:hypothetical protein
MGLAEVVDIIDIADIADIADILQIYCRRLPQITIDYSRKQQIVIEGVIKCVP